MRARPVEVLVTVVALLTGWAWLGGESRERAPRAGRAFERGYYAAPVANETAVIAASELGEGPCELIISSLGDGGSTYQVTLRSLLAQPALRSRLERVEAIAGLDRAEPAAPSTVEEPSVTQTSPPAPHAPGGAVRDRRFFLHVTESALEDPLAYVPVEATLACEGEQVRVYCDRGLGEGEFDPALAEEIVRTLDERILPRSAEIIGRHRDVDGDGKLAVLLTGWLGRLRGGTTSVNGFVRSGDFNSQGTAPYSNQADVIYLNAAVSRGPALTALLAHEYTHAVCCSARNDCAAEWGWLPDEADWLSEAMAHVAERLHGAGWSNLDRRVHAFLENTSSSPLVVADYYRSGRWRDAGCRGATFLFLEWCLAQTDEALLRELADDPQVGLAKLERVAGVPFPALYRGWTIGLHQGRVGALDLHRPLGDCRLDGPRRIAWRPADGDCQLQLQGTATAFVRVETRGPLPTISIAADSGARLQVTVAAGAAPVHDDPSRSREPAGASPPRSPLTASRGK